MPAPTQTLSLIRRLLKDENYIQSALRHYQLREQFIQRPAIAATLDMATDPPTKAQARLYTVANKRFTLFGTNAVDAGSVLAAGGGVTLTTAGAAADQMIVAPAAAVNTVETSGWNTCQFLSQKEVRFFARISTGASIAGIRIQAGLKLLATSLDDTTDADQVFFSYDTGSAVSATRWVMRTSVGAANAGVAAPNGVAAVVASTSYNLEIRLNASRVPSFYINGYFCGVGAALTTAIAFKPVIGVHAIAAAAKVLSVRTLECSRLW